jgi:hypothetical protein
MTLDRRSVSLVSDCRGYAPGPGELVQLTHIAYTELNARQKENYNYVKVSALLADYGFVALRLSDDWQGADFIAQHIDGETFLKVQLKSRLTFSRDYEGKDLYIAFPDRDAWYLYPHDHLLAVILNTTDLIGSSESWTSGGEYSFRQLSKNLEALLAPYQLVSREVDSPVDSHVPPRL